MERNLKQKAQRRKKMSKRQKGITLIALVITIVVMLILAGVSLSMTLGDNGILSQAQNAVRKNEVGAFLEEANMAYAELYADEASRTLGSAEVTLADVVARLVDKDTGYGRTIETSVADGVTGISLSTTEVTLVKGVEGKTEKAVSVTLTGSSGMEYYAKIKDNYYKMSLNGTGIQLGEALSEKPTGEGAEVVLTAVSSEEGNVETEVNTESKTVTIRLADSAVPTNATVTISYGEYSEDVAVKVKEKAIAFREYGPAINGTTYGTAVQVNGGSAITVGSETIADNWKLFYEDENFKYLIYGDYYPVAAQTNSDVSTINTAAGGTNYPWAINDSTSRVNLLKYLKNNSGYTWENSSSTNYGPQYGTSGTYASWNNLKTALSGLSYFSGKTIEIQGSPDIELWVNSWNAKGNTALKVFDGQYGYELGLSTAASAPSVHYINVKTNSKYNTTANEANGAGYYDTLYFPYRSYTANSTTDNSGKAYGYWLASPGGEDTGAMCGVYSHGYVFWNGVYDGDSRCARPVVAIEK